MPSEEFEIDVLEASLLTPLQLNFVNQWSHEYFGEVTVTEGLAKAQVHWRLFLRSRDDLLCHVAITEMKIELDGERTVAGAIGGLMTPLPIQGRGYGNTLMDRAEELIFSELGRSIAILFCLDELVPFYEKRGWSLITQPVTLEQRDRVVTWGAATMILQHDRKQTGDRLIHVPQSGKT